MEIKIDFSRLLKKRTETTLVTVSKLYERWRSYENCFHEHPWPFPTPLPYFWVSRSRRRRHGRVARFAGRVALVRVPVVSVVTCGSVAAALFDARDGHARLDDVKRGNQLPVNMTSGMFLARKVRTRSKSWEELKVMLHWSTCNADSQRMFFARICRHVTLLNRFQKLPTRCSTANIAKNRSQRAVTLEWFFAQHHIIASWRCKLTSVTSP